MTSDDRRGRAEPFRLAGALPIDVLVPMARGDHLVLPGTVVAIAGSTITVEMADGVAALTVATTNRCVVVWGPDEDEQCALVRAGRRIDDVHSPTTIELVLEEVRPLADVAGSASR